MNPYEISQASSDTIQSLLEVTERLHSSCGFLPGLESVVQNLKKRLIQLQQVHSRSWHLLRHNNEHAELIMARLESMDALCGRMVPIMEAAKGICNKKLARIKSSRYGMLRRANSCCYSFNRDELLEVAEAVSEELRTWLDYQEGILELLSCQAFGVFPRLQALTLEGYQPIAKVMKRISEVLVDGNQRAIVIYGPLGIGKSSLATYVASNPPECFSDGAVELHLGKACSLLVSRQEYEQQLFSKLRILLHDLNCQKEVIQRIANLRDAWSLLEEVLQESAYLIVLDDIWEKEIADRFMQLRNHSCKFFMTCQDDPVYESYSVCTLSLGFKETCSVSREILKFHCGMMDSHTLPAAATKLLRYCSHHPLAVTILGEALRGSWRTEEWNAVVTHFQSYSSSSGMLKIPMSEPMNWLAGVLSSIELSIVGMGLETQSLFKALAALSWAQPVPVECLKALWSAVGNDSPFLVQTRELVRRHLLKRSSDFLLYELHEVVEMYLEGRVSIAMDMLLNLSQPVTRALVAPWLLHFGNRKVKEAAAGTLRGILMLDNEELHAKALAIIVDVLKACADNKEQTSKEFNSIVGPEIVNLLFRASSPSTNAAITKYIAACFTDMDYEEYGRGLVASGLLEKLRLLLSNNNLGVNILVKNDVADVLARLAGTRDSYVAENMLKTNLIKDLVMLLDSRSGWIHEGVINAIVKMAEVGDSTVEQILKTDMIDKLYMLLHNRKHLVKCKALSTFESLIRAGGSLMLDKILASDLLEELNVLLSCPSEDVQLNASILCQQLCSVARGSSSCVDKVLKTQLIETLTGLLHDDFQALRTCAVVSLRNLVQARGKVVSERIVRAAGMESIQKGLEFPHGYTAYKQLLKSICENN